jgi:hypothetical protein
MQSSAGIQTFRSNVFTHFQGLSVSLQKGSVQPEEYTAQQSGRSQSNNSYVVETDLGVMEGKKEVRHLQADIFVTSKKYLNMWVLYQVLRL